MPAVPTTSLAAASPFAPLPATPAGPPLAADSPSAPPAAVSAPPDTLSDSDIAGAPLAPQQAPDTLTDADVAGAPVTKAPETLTDADAATAQPTSTVSRPQAVQMYLDSDRKNPELYRKLFQDAAVRDAPSLGLNDIGNPFKAVVPMVSGMVDAVLASGRTIGDMVEADPFAKPGDATPGAYIKSAVVANGVNALNTIRNLADNVTNFVDNSRFGPDHVRRLAGVQFDQDIQGAQLERETQQNLN